MFGFFKKKRSVLDELAQTLYGEAVPAGRPDREQAIGLARDTLLAGLIGDEEVRRVAVGLDDGPMPYSTHTLALCTALNLYRQPQHRQTLQLAQLTARMTALQWAQEGRIPRMMLATFEQSLYDRYKA